MAQSLIVYDHEYFMRAALQEADKARDLDEIPVGAVLVMGRRIIARGYNNTQRLQDVTAHAEMIAMTAGAEFLGSKYLPECTLYVTLEPCIMCAGALRWAQLGGLVYGAGDEKAGFMRYGKELLHPKTKLEYGVLHEDCAQMMKDYFATKRRLRP